MERECPLPDNYELPEFDCDCGNYNRKEDPIILFYDQRPSSPVTKLLESMIVELLKSWQTKAKSF